MKMELLHDLFIISGRVVTILPLLLVMALYMGKRSIGQLPIFDFLVIVTLASVTGADIADPSVGHLQTAYAIVLIAFLQKIMAKLIVKNRQLGKLLTFEPTVIMENGQFIFKNVKKVNYTINNILQMLRENNVFDISEVKLAIVEANGNISVLKKDEKSVVTIEDLATSKKSSSLAYPVIIEGVLYEEPLRKLQLTKEWFLKEMKQQGIQQVEDIFFASITEDKTLHFSTKNEKSTAPPMM